MKASLPPAEPSAWAAEYQPWHLLFNAMMLVGKQVAPLLLAYWKICEWNPQHYLISSGCHRETFGWIAYPCEGTKMFARCFPLLATSVSLVVVGRFILQARMYYHLLMKEAMLVFQNYKVYQDPAVFLLGCCFATGVSHFLIDLCIPPYLVSNIEKMSNIAMFLLPCVVFFVVLMDGCNIEKHLVTLNKFYEEDVHWARQQLEGVKVYSEEQIRISSHQLQQQEKAKELHNGERDVSLEHLLGEAIRGAAPSDESMTQTTSISDSMKKSRTDLFRGLWPGEILLANGLDDDESKSFKKAMRLYMGIFVILHLLVLGTLIASAIREYQDVFPNRRPTGSLGIDGSYYQNLGRGYCRDDSMQRPECVWMGWKDLEKESTSDPVTSANKARRRTVVREQSTSKGALTVDPVLSPHNLTHERTAFLSSSTNVTFTRSLATYRWRPKEHPEEHITMCGSHCSSNDDCIGFSVDEAYCYIYTSHHIEAPPGWTTPSEHQTRFASAQRIPRVVQTNNHDLASCWGKQRMTGEPQDITGTVVCVLHVLIILFILVRTVRHLGDGDLKWW